LVPSHPARTLPMRIRCGWSPTWTRAISRCFRYEITETASSPLTDTKQSAPRLLFVDQYGLGPTLMIL
jgi:hypothetical protein